MFADDDDGDWQTTAICFNEEEYLHDISKLLWLVTIMSEPDKQTQKNHGSVVALLPGKFLQKSGKFLR